jgi:exopolyphosphatase/guanosine-5'-triphosphate,3'-diphosphate pyrophosphatase
MRVWIERCRRPAEAGSRFAAWTGGAAVMTTGLHRRRRTHGSRRRYRDFSEPAYAALDLGTNNCRLLVATPDTDGGFRVVDAFSRIVRLGEGLGQAGRLSPEAMSRTIDALRVCAGKIRRGAVSGVRSVATEACRQAENCEEFLERVTDETGLTIETISSAEEARLVLQGCLPLFEKQPSYGLVFDIGGGSTEVVWVRFGPGRADIVDWISMPLGVVTLSERYGRGTIPAAEYDRLIAEVDAYLTPFCARYGIADAVARGAVQMLGTSGTVTTLCGVNLRLPRYDRSVVDGTYLGFESIERICHMLRRMDCAGRAALPCIGSERADLVVSGCAVLEAICKRWPVGKLKVADRGIREGILCELMQDNDAGPSAGPNAPGDHGGR